MKKMLKINVVLMAFLLLTGGMLSAQGWGRGTDPGQYCANIPGLTDKQKGELTELATKHRAEMDALRAERQNSANSESWYAAGQKMREATDKHRFEILSVLTPEQKQVFAPRSTGNVGPVGRMGGRGAGMVAPAGMVGRGAGMVAPARMGGRGQAMVPPCRMGGGRGWRR